MSSGAVRDLFKRSSLSLLSRTAKRLPGGAFGDSDFAKFQIETLESVLGSAKFDFCAVSTIRLNHNFMPSGFDCVLHNIDAALIENYDSVAAYDDLSPVVHLNPGRLISHDLVFDTQSWLSSPLYTKHCRVFGFDKILRVAFQYPGMERKVISFDYLGAGENRTWETLDHRLLEIATFPFALSWLFRKGAIDEPRYDRHMERLADLTPTQIMYLRKYVNSPWQDLSLQAKEMGYSHGGYKQTLYSIRDSIIDKLSIPEGNAYTHKSRSLRTIDHDYGFLRMLGDPSLPLVRKP